MLKFIHFLREANVSGQGPNAARHYSKYVEPWLPGNSRYGESGQKLASSVRYGNSTIPAGTDITILGHAGIKNGVHHIEVRTGHDETLTIPVNKLKKLHVAGKRGQPDYTDEHALERVWNHYVSSDKNKLHSEEGMMADIQAAKKDPNHPLSFENAPSKGFTGGKKSEEHRSAYYREMENGARTISDMSSHPDFKKSIEAGHEAKVLGGSRYKLSSTYDAAGVRGAGATSKTDIKIGPHNISLKKGDNSPTVITKANDITGIRPIFTKGKGGYEDSPLVMRLKGRNAQIASSGPGEFRAIHHHAINQLNLPSEETADAKNKIDRIAAIMKTGGKDHLQKKAEIGSIYDTLHKKYGPKLGQLVTREAATGEGKFADENSEGTATHIVTSRRQ
jgi:hypothetical protein